MEDNQKKKVSVKYFPTANTVRIATKSTNILPLYAKYLFQYLKIPLDATIRFSDRTIKGGINTWLKENNGGTD